MSTYMLTLGLDGQADTRVLRGQCQQGLLYDGRSQNPGEDWSVINAQLAMFGWFERADIDGIDVCSGFISWIHLYL